ncbi:hypothetical protein D5S17_02450 [Pseudonocardiaceae bacterium YIM PH 21723]|nr:hypothetical protein D5S17_02450 [Pseudonocardiaceae bacterium YIM PH 21723]
MDPILATLRAEGIDAEGVVDPELALAAIPGGGFEVLQLGGGVPAEPRAALKELAAAHGMRVLEESAADWQDDFPGFARARLLPHLR